MKQPIQKSAIPESKTFLIQELKDAYFDPNWHFHREYQLFVVLKGSGTRFVGNNISHFEAGDMVFTGSNLPHVWRSDEIYFENHDLQTHGIVIYFSDNFMGDAFLNKEEMSGIRELFLRANRGLEVAGHTKDFILKKMKSLLKLDGFDGVLTLLQTLNILANSTEVKYINKAGYLNTVTDSDSERMRKVHDFIPNNYRGNILLNDAASLANLSPTSFSRYFKARTNKTFSDFVTELRIGQACKLLLNKDASITQIAYECGYQTLSHFNRKFKEMTGTNPMNYKKAYSSLN